jgi:hypothetical protein
MSSRYCSMLDLLIDTGYFVTICRWTPKEIKCSVHTCEIENQYGQFAAGEGNGSSDFGPSAYHK